MFPSPERRRGAPGGQLAEPCGCWSLHSESITCVHFDGQAVTLWRWTAASLGPMFFACGPSPEPHRDSECRKIGEMMVSEQAARADFDQRHAILLGREDA